MQLVGVGALFIIGGYWALSDRGPSWALESVPWQRKSCDVYFCGWREAEV